MSIRSYYASVRVHQIYYLFEKNVQYQQVIFHVFTNENQKKKEKNAMSGHETQQWLKKCSIHCCCAVGLSKQKFMRHEENDLKSGLVIDLLNVLPTTIECALNVRDAVLSMYAYGCY